MLDLEVGEVSRALKADPCTRGRTDELMLRSFPSVSIDTRTLEPGEAFFAITGPHFDGNDFILEAFRKGALLAVASSAPDQSQLPSDGLVLVVPDPLEALQQFASQVRQTWGRQLVAITGSMGKTTTREFSSSILSSRYKVFQSPGNLNNEIGLPLSLTQLTEEHDIAVLELGMNHPGEIARLGEICQPSVGVITNVAPVHIEFFSGLDEIARAKGEILDSLGSSGDLHFNSDDERVSALAKKHLGPCFSFGFGSAAETRVSDFKFSTLRRMDLHLETRTSNLSACVPFVGRPYLYNIAAAVSVGIGFGLDATVLAESLERLAPLPMRGHTFRLGSVTIWDDTYNSNPRAVENLLETVSYLQSYRRRILVLGAMFELGEHSQALHFRVGQAAAECGADLIVAVGKEALHIQEGAAGGGYPDASLHHFDLAAEAADFLGSRLEPGDLVVVKGSRGMKMERVVEHLRGVLA